MFEEKDRSEKEEEMQEEPHKAVCICVDCSCSMSNNRRIQLAKDNVLKIIDEHVADDDYLAMVRFHTNCEVVFGLQLVGPVRAELREKAIAACYVEGSTALYDVSDDPYRPQKKTTHCSPSLSTGHFRRM